MLRQPAQKKPKKRHGGPAKRQPKHDPRKHHKRPKPKRQSPPPRLPPRNPELEARLQRAASADRVAWERDQAGLRQRYRSQEPLAPETDQEAEARRRRYQLGPSPPTAQQRAEAEQKYNREVAQVERENTLAEEEERHRARQQRHFDATGTRFDPMRETVVPGSYSPDPKTLPRPPTRLGGRYVPARRQEMYDLDARTSSPAQETPEEMRPVPPGKRRKVVLGGGKRPERRERMYDLSGRTYSPADAPKPEAPKPEEKPRGRATAAQRLGEARLAKLRSSVPRQDTPEPEDNPNRPTESEEGRIRAMREKRTAGKLKPLGRSLSREPEDLPQRERPPVYTPFTGDPESRGAPLGLDPIAPISLAGTKPGPEKRLHKRKQKDYRTEEQKEEQERQQREKYAEEMEKAQPKDAPRPGPLYPKTFERTGGAARK